MPCGCGSTTGADCLCGVTGTPGIVVDGNGSQASPYLISPELSALDDNVLTVEDDGLYVRAADAIDVACFEDGDGNELNPDPDTGCIRVPQYACILDYAGEKIAPNGDNCVQLPTSGAPPPFDGGLTTTPQGDLTIDVTNTWPLSPLSGPAFVGNALTGGQTYIDTAGQLRTAPEHTCVVVNGSLTTLWSGDSYITSGETWYSPAYGAVAISNPSTTRTMRVAIFVYASVHAAAPPVGGFFAAVQRDSGGGYVSIGDPNPAFPYNAAGATIIDEKQHLIVAQTSVGPESTYSANYRVGLNNSGSSGTATRRHCYMKVDMIGWTQ